jgi:hypothetical protein
VRLPLTKGCEATRWRLERALRPLIAMEETLMAGGVDVLQS